MCDGLGGGEILLLSIMFLIFNDAVECISSSFFFFFLLSIIKLYEYTRFYFSAFGLLGCF